jgi:hypothetical protein
MKECSVVVLNKEIISFCLGSEYFVDFNILDVYEKVKKTEGKKNLVFVHTHPFQTVGICSEQDKKAIKNIKAVFGDDFEFTFIVLGRENCGSYFFGKEKSLYFFPLKISFLFNLLMEMSSVA